MAKSAKTPPLGSASFWDMAALAVDGWLASCQSCVEFYYLQSRQNAIAFLDSCASGGLVQKISLLNLRGDLSSGSLRYNQAIYISAPVFRMKNPDAARKRTEGTKIAVYNAFHLYYEVLREDDQAINAAYMKAVREGKLRYPRIAKKRRDVNLSPVAELRVILDGHRCAISNKHPKMSRPNVEKRAIEETVNYVFSCSGSNTRRLRVRDHAEELEEFILEFLADWRDLKGLSPKGGREIPVEGRLQLLRVISKLVRHRYDVLRKSGDFSRASDFSACVKEEISKAQEQAADNTAYVEALSKVNDDLDVHLSDRRMSIPTLAIDSSQHGAEARSI